MNLFNLRRGVAIAALALSAIFAAAPSYANENVGQRSTKIDASDSATFKEIVALSVPANNAPVSTRETAHYTHKPFWFWQTSQDYTITYSGTAEFVDRLGYWMNKDVDGDYFRFNAGNTTGFASARANIDIGARGSLISNMDRGSVVSVSGRSFGTFNVLSRYTHAEVYDDVVYTMNSSATATFVPEQNAYMAWIGSDLYRMRNGSTEAVHLYSKPVVDVGYQYYKLDSSDTMTNVTINPVSLTDGNRSVLVNVRRVYQHNETFQVKEYYGESTDVARYNSDFRVWTVLVDGRIFAVAFDDDYVSDSSVVVVHAPSGLHRPDVVVVNPSNNDDPPVVVPSRRRPPVVSPSTNDDPPVVVPSRRRPPVVSPSDNDDPPVVVPSRKRPPVVINNGDDDGPAVVIPGRH